MARTVTMIPQKINPLTHQPNDTLVKRKVAAYARVSTDLEEQQTSYEAQVRYYTEYIKKNPEWEFVKVYTDEGISATSTKHREGFNSMIEDALAGKIDLIMTKSVSRFARNTVDSLSTIRLLKEHNVECWFEKENIFTFDGKGELLISIMSSLAQEESRSISENVTWGQRRRFAEGKVSMPYSSFLGYKRGENGEPVVVPEEAEIVRYIYRSFLEGQTSSRIAKALTTKGIPSPAGKEKWYSTTVESILTNEKYMGAALLQKTFTADFLTKRKQKNNGEVPQYYVNESHEAIIPPDEFEEVQNEIARRKEIGRSYSGNALFSAKIVCNECGHYFGAKVWHSTSKYRRIIWQCNGKFKYETHCSTPHFYEDAIKDKFVIACKSVLENREDFLAACQQVRDLLSDCTALERKVDELFVQQNEVNAILQAYIR
ncbi:MAG: recombinase family protein, partial [Ruminococcus sp.]|nr:recombinase family protein [Ruminococcus sp.]